MSIQDSPQSFRFTVILIISIGVGSFLRLYLIADQVLLDDEWHGLFYAAGHSLTHILRYTTADATCAPLNAYAWILLHTIGWSEIALRLPSLFFGILALVALPLLVRRIHGKAVACIFAVFLSLSPFLVLYSRIFRPYSSLVFFEFVAIYAAGIWLHTGDKRFQWIYLFTSLAALYFHPVAAIGVFAPWVVAGSFFLLRKKASNIIRLPALNLRWQSVVLTLGIILLFFALTLQPDVIAKNFMPGNSINVETLNFFMTILFGTSLHVLAGGLLLICLIGVWSLLREHFFGGVLFILVTCLHILMVTVWDFSGIDVPVVLARYLAILFPLAYVGLAIGLVKIYAMIESFYASQKPFLRKSVMILAIFIFALWIFTNPLWYIYSAPNNFTNHPAFILEGQPHLEVDLLGPPNMSSFYHSMPDRTQRLIEYPMMLGDHYNLYYYYQHNHGKQIFIGYTDIVDSMPLHRDGVSAEFLINHVIRAVDDKRAIKFRNMVNILDTGAVRSSRADFLICHKNLYKEFLPGEHQSFAKPPMPGFKECVEHSTNNFGQPEFEDENIVVFDLSNKLSLIKPN